MRAFGEVVETPLPLQHRGKLVELGDNVETANEALHVAGAGLIEMLYMSFGLYRAASKARRDLGQFQREVLAELGIDPDTVDTFDMDKNVIIHMKKAKAN